MLGIAWHTTAYVSMGVWLTYHPYVNKHVISCTCTYTPSVFIRCYLRILCISGGPIHDHSDW